MSHCRGIKSPIQVINDEINRRNNDYNDYTQSILNVFHTHRVSLRNGGQYYDARESDFDREWTGYSYTWGDFCK
jgi:hypothetical protein